jgi:hypothetical protein
MDTNFAERQCSPTHEGEPNNNEIRKDDTEPNVLGVASCSAYDISFEVLEEAYLRARAAKLEKEGLERYDEYRASGRLVDGDPKTAMEMVRKLYGED